MLTFSKTATANLPIMQLRLVASSEPCSVGNQSPKIEVPYYPLERDRDNNCEESKLNKQRFDRRYKKTDFTYSVGYLHREMGVFNHRDLPGFE